MIPTSIGYRLVVIVLLLSTIAMTVEAFVSIQASSDSLRTVISDSVIESHQAVARSLDAELASLSALANDLADTVAARATWTPSDLRSEVIEAVNDARVPVSGVSVYRADLPQIFTFDYRLDDARAAGPTTRFNARAGLPADAWVFDVVNTNQTRWQGPTDALFGDGVMVSVAEPIHLPNQPATGVVWIDISTDTLQSLITLDIESAGYNFIISPTGDFIGASVDVPAESVFTPLADLTMGGDLLPVGDPLDGGAASFAVGTALESVPWQYVTVVPRRLIAVTLPFSASGQIIMVTILGVAILGFAVQRYIFTNVAEPLERLSTAAQEIGSGDMRYQIDYGKRRDEIGRLARALDDMKVNLSASYEELARWSRTLEDRVNRRTSQLEQTRREAEQNANELRAVYDESLLVVSAYQLQTILQTLSNRILTLLEGSYCAVWLVNEDDEQTMRLVASTASEQEFIGTIIDVNQGMVGMAVREMRLLVVDDYPGWSQRLQMKMSDRIHQAMCVPLMFSGEPIGAVIVGRTFEDPPFEVNDQRLLRLFANLVSPSVRNAQLFVQRDEAVREAERANQVKTRFLASVTHELRTPLNLVINNMDFMKIGAFGEVNEEQIERLNQTIRSAEHLLYLINDLLDVSKIEAGEMQLFIQPNDVYTVVHDALDNARVLLETKKAHIGLQEHVAEGLPQVPMDARRVRQVLVNLLSNAIKFTEEGAVTFRVHHDAHAVYFSVSDTGMGIPPEEANKLFEAFERTRSAKEKAIEGTGLGLPISKHLVELHGGELTFESEVGQGTTFTFYLPLHQPTDREDVGGEHEMATVLRREPR